MIKTCEGIVIPAEILASFHFSVEKEQNSAR